MEQLNVPKHIAVILDGNGRWAKAKGLPRNAGHIEGAKTVEKMCETMWNKGVEYFTVYAFSTENWNRPSEEVALLMKLLREYMIGCIKRSMKNNMKVRVIGDKTRLADDIRKSIDDLEEATKNNTGLKFTIAINYGSRDEIRRAVKSIISDAKSGKIDEDDVTEELISSRLDTAGYPDPDLLVRTSGEERISNYLLWQIAYSELYFTNVYWPDFNEKELDKAIESYSNRNRRFGKL